MDIYNNIDEREFNFDDEEEGPTSLVDDEGDFARQIIENDYKEAIKAYDAFALKEMGVTSLVTERQETTATAATPTRPLIRRDRRDSVVGGVGPGTLGALQFGQRFEGEAGGPSGAVPENVAASARKPRTQRRIGEQTKRKKLFTNYPTILSRLFAGNVRSALVNPSTYEDANQNTRNTIQQTLTSNDINNNTKRNIISGLFRIG